MRLEQADRSQWQRAVTLPRSGLGIRNPGAAFASLGVENPHSIDILLVYQ
jgi:hypothetical protein